MAQFPPTSELGSEAGERSGWALYGNPGDDIENVTELQWPNSTITYARMMNDAQIQSLMNGLLLPIRAYRWYIDPNSAPSSVVNRVATDYNLPIGEEGDFFRRRGQKRFSFAKHMEDALRALVYGHYVFEQVGEIEPDLKWHLRKLAPRPPRTITEWDIAEDGMLKAVVQGYQYPKEIRLPVERLVVYVWDREGSNWAGRSFLRCVYRNHLVKDRILRVGAINIERAGGVPYIEAPEGAGGDVIKELDALARKFRVGEGAGAALPHGAQLKFAAAASGDGSVAYIKQQNEEMARAFLQMVNMLGQTNSGSRALGDTFHDILRIAQYTIAKWFCDVFNEHVIEDDVEFNEGPSQEYAPLLKFDAGLQDPMMGFQQEVQKNQQDPNTGLSVSDPTTIAMLTTGTPSTVRRQRSVRRASGQGEIGGRVPVAGGVASPITASAPPTSSLSSSARG